MTTLEAVFFAKKLALGGSQGLDAGGPPLPRSCRPPRPGPATACCLQDPRKHAPLLPQNLPAPPLPPRSPPGSLPGQAVLLFCHCVRHRSCTLDSAEVRGGGGLAGDTEAAPSQNRVQGPGPGPGVCLPRPPVGANTGASLRRTVSRPGAAVANAADRGPNRGGLFSAGAGGAPSRRSRCQGRAPAPGEGPSASLRLPAAAGARRSLREELASSALAASFRGLCVRVSPVLSVAEGRPDPG